MSAEWGGFSAAIWLAAGVVSAAPARRAPLLLSMEVRPGQEWDEAEGIAPRRKSVRPAMMHAWSDVLSGTFRI